MNDTAKYLIHAAITADGVVERSDVVGAIFGQTEGLLGEELDLRALRDSSKVGRIDVEISSEGGTSFGEVTVASSLDRVETAILAASLETITRVGPCRARVEVTEVEDVREAKRRAVVERAKELLAESFDDGVMTSGDILEEVRESAGVEEIAEYEGLPAGPGVADADADAVIVVEGRADVLTLLDHGIENVVAVEGTDVPDAVADLTTDRTATAFLDGDRGGELILRELAQVGDVDYVAFAPEGQSVEDLDREAATASLRGKVPYDRLPAEGDLRAATHELSTGVDDGPPPRTGPPGTDRPAAVDARDRDDADAGAVADDADAAEPVTLDGADGGERAATDGASVTPDDGAVTDDGAVGRSIREHVRQVIGGETGRVRLLDRDLSVLAEDDASAAFERLERAESVPRLVVLDGELDQRTLDVAAQRGVEGVVARSTGEFVKQPVGVRVRTADQLTA